MNSKVYTIHITDGKPIKIAIENRNGEPISEEEDSYFSEICKSDKLEEASIFAKEMRDKYYGEYSGNS